ncbi:hypothetical protein Clacol_008209 [Clathrus columnatus]|uniref:Acid phosphatase n=1 Tax=Clathrus columnatus TaxID=1419009 RepID=A0AAV5AH30_9AGAM|nr:hypothetical protein Clacol_008209 [Clathrus columnatus]
MVFSLATLLPWTLPIVVLGAQAPNFKAPSEGPLIASPNFGGPSNSTLPKSPIVPGRAFDRFLQIWFENTDFATASSTTVFRQLAQQGILLNNYFALTHPSEPNYVASVGGDFFGMHDDNLYNIPTNISTIVDLLEAKNVSWAEYQESMPSDGFQGFNFTQQDYVTPSAPPYTYYVRKHNPLIIFDSVASIPSRAARIRNFNDFAADVNASAIPQWAFITPNLVDDAHDTNIDYAAQWIQFWLLPLLNNTDFNDNRTVVMITFDENETMTINNQVLTLLLGGGIPEKLRGTTDSTYYTHYSILSTVQNNWGLGSLGRGDTNATMANVFSFVAEVTGWKNVNVTDNAIPLTNISGPIPGPLNSDVYIPFTAPNVSAVGAGGGKVFVAPNINLNLTAANAPAAVNLTGQGLNVPASGPLNSSATAPAPGSSPTTSGASNLMRMTIKHLSMLTVFVVCNPLLWS